MKIKVKLFMKLCIAIGIVWIVGDVYAAEKSTDEICYLSREEILNVKETDNRGTLFKWNEYKTIKSSEHDGIIPADLLDDDIYCSMNLPSESKSEEMIRMYRDNGSVMNKMSEGLSTLTGMGAVYKTHKTILPEKFTLCLGKIKTFVYLKSKKNWVLIDEQPYPAGVYLYRMPWTEHSRKKCSKIKTYSDHIEMEMTDDEFEGYALHFWGKKTKVDQKDVLYVACAYDFWVKEKGNSGHFTATIGIDAKDEKGSDSSTVQLFYSRGLDVTSEKKTHWGQTIPNDIYDPLNDGHVLDLLYDKWWNVSK